MSINNTKFDKNKTYAIGELQNHCSPDDAPQRFRKTPTPPIYITGGELHSRGIKTVYDFLAKNTPFKVGALVYFFEVVYDNEQQSLKHFFTGSVLTPAHQTSLSDEGEAVQTQAQGGFPVFNVPNNDASSKLFLKSQADQIASLTQINASDRQAFDKERKELYAKIDGLNNEIVNLNITINTLTAEKTALEIRYEESQKVMQMLNSKEEPAEEEPQGLADKAVGAIDAVLGDGASSQIVAGLANGAGSAIPKLLDIGIAWAQSKGLIPVAPAPEPVQSPAQDTVQSLHQQLPEQIFN